MFDQKWFGRIHAGWVPRLGDLSSVGTGSMHTARDSVGGDIEARGEAEGFASVNAGGNGKGRSLLGSALLRLPYAATHLGKNH